MSYFDTHDTFDGSWENDRLDIRGIRFDAEMERLYELKHYEDDGFVEGEYDGD